ncbi:MAG: hypothetical protein ACRDN0_02930, partial [Trebonia sp.]
MAGALVITVGVGVPATVLLTQTGAEAAASTISPGTDISDSFSVSSWPGVASAGDTFVGIEAVQGTGSNSTLVNANYASESSAAASAGLFVMPYVFADPAKVTTGADQFD